jgi:hypothetical protein
MIALILAVSILNAKRVQLRPMLQVICAGVCVSALIAVFYTLVGWIVSRLAYAVVPPLIAIAAATAVGLAKQVPPWHGWMLAAGCMTVSIVQSVLTVIKAQPFL